MSCTAVTGLDKSFLVMVKEIQRSYQTLSKQYKLRIEKWIEKLVITSAENLIWRKHRNDYAKLLLSMVILKRLSEPFHTLPPDGPLAHFPKRLATYHLKSKAADSHELTFWTDIYHRFEKQPKEYSSSSSFRLDDSTDSNISMKDLPNDRDIKYLRMCDGEHKIRIELLEQQLKDEKLHYGLQVQRLEHAHKMEATAYAEAIASTSMYSNSAFNHSMAHQSMSQSMASRSILGLEKEGHLDSLHHLDSASQHSLQNQSVISHFEPSIAEPITEKVQQPPTPNELQLPPSTQFPIVDILEDSFQKDLSYVGYEGTNYHPTESKGFHTAERDECLRSSMSHSRDNSQDVFRRPHSVNFGTFEDGTGTLDPEMNTARRMVKPPMSAYKLYRESSPGSVHSRNTLQSRLDDRGSASFEKKNETPSRSQNDNSFSRNQNKNNFSRNRNESSFARNPSTNESRNPTNMLTKSMSSISAISATVKDTSHSVDFSMADLRQSKPLKIQQNDDDFLVYIEKFQSELKRLQSTSPLRVGAT